MDLEDVVVVEITKTIIITIRVVAADLIRIIIMVDTTETTMETIEAPTITITTITSTIITGGITTIRVARVMFQMTGMGSIS